MVSLLCCRKFYNETICPDTLQFDCHAGNIQREYLVWVCSKVNLPASFWTLSIKDFFQRKKLYNGKTVRTTLTPDTALVSQRDTGKIAPQPQALTAVQHVPAHTWSSRPAQNHSIRGSQPHTALPDTAGPQSTVSVKRNECIRGLGPNWAFLSENNLAVKRFARMEAKQGLQNTEVNTNRYFNS